MNTIAPSAAEAVNYMQPISTDNNNAPTKPLVICGSCGAIEQTVEGGRTECPHCDEYIY